MKSSIFDFIWKIKLLSMNWDYEFGICSTLLYYKIVTALHLLGRILCYSLNSSVAFKVFDSRFESKYGLISTIAINYAVFLKTSLDLSSFTNLWLKFWFLKSFRFVDLDPPYGILKRPKLIGTILKLIKKLI
jgi:hypothetical protein